MDEETKQAIELLEEVADKLLFKLSDAQTLLRLTTNREHENYHRIKVIDLQGALILVQNQIIILQTKK